MVQQTEVPAGLRWAISQGLWSFKVRTPAAFLKLAKNYSLAGIADRIRCPVFVGDAVDDLFLKGQPAAMRDALEDRATHVVFTEDSAG
ncbi:hypothetical protein K469DRAFT_705070 [Zopfia rhizophila CBS 207.26]|uniref:Uncharacterized protein n=1 Tax=Zopfia rhizophila CBS 207.26 TaxID=1314779 RepID=A0A6A6EB65_9PEZI|nr:hypothetical protein K469DRAFT_705070 [Zopfia rhizophila CBS 207.26]